jgi:hypothetical protein
MSSSQSRPATTTDAGIPVASQEHSLTIGPDGPVFLQDFYLIEQMANFKWATTRRPGSSDGPPERHRGYGWMPKGPSWPESIRNDSVSA